MQANTLIYDVAQLASVLSVVVGVVISVLSFNRTRRLEAAAPALELRQNLYRETARIIAIIVNPGLHTPAEIDAARKRFRELYVCELSMVEDHSVEAKMFELARLIDPEATQFTPEQSAAYYLAHALRDSFVSSWRIAR